MFDWFLTKTKKLIADEIELMVDSVTEGVKDASKAMWNSMREELLLPI